MLTPGGSCISALGETMFGLEVWDVSGPGYKVLHGDEYSITQSYDASDSPSTDGSLGGSIALQSHSAAFTKC